MSNKLTAHLLSLQPSEILFLYDLRSSLFPRAKYNPNLGHEFFSLLVGQLTYTYRVSGKDSTDTEYLETLVAFLAILSDEELADIL